jgi:hypothetical protein
MAKSLVALGLVLLAAGSIPNAAEAKTYCERLGDQQVDDAAHRKERSERQPLAVSALKPCLTTASTVLSPPSL